MRAYSLNELFRLTRSELLGLHAEIVAELNRLPESSVERPVDLENLRQIRRMLTMLRAFP